MKPNARLWLVQGLLAALFLLTGGMKLFSPASALQGPIGVPVGFLRFIGAAELLGAIGLIVPWLTGIWPVLTPVAGAGLVVIMLGATVVTAAGMSVLLAVFPLLIGALAISIVVGRGRELRASR